MLTWLDTQRVSSRRKKTAEHVPLDLLQPKAFRPLGAGDMPLVFLAHNDFKFMRSLLAHYRALGVTRFICVDDRSDDGTREFLCAQSDVDVWVSGVRYREAKRGKLWREWLFARYGKNRWYLNIDADEYLVYDECDKRRLPDLIQHLESRGIRRLSAPMIDMYPAGSVASFTFDGTDDRRPWDVANSIDGDGYVIERMKRFASLCGGPRVRKFGTEAELMKYPLLYWDDACSYGVSIHQPLPFERNFQPILGVLLHFKFFADFQQKTQDAVADKQYFNGAQEYQRILDAVAESGELDFVYAGTVEYKGVKQLLDLGFMRSPWTL
ncbi:glycosyltransferase family 2 protein [Pararhizobium antarcticum]|uniref:Glycosyl transferase family 2 n=1 Tax=Pararhizobium antarcticum TaxID=1798805 RepID=A0A657LTS5_9HYPH|nr:glycosyltransferase family 2 protein [Pararhizobium antarcticum]OJF96954.1 hypothetical protein AX760_02635 [Pararhizobium antarcticum]OJF99017.1 hypothetical protein AX761_12080 [Rhizobium sp. 58]